MSNGNEMVKPAPTAVARQGFGTQEIEQRRETQGNALAARAQAEVQARYIVAMQRPRNLLDVRIRLLEHCKRVAFAERAEYAKPVGGSRVRGPSIRFVECALQEYGNVMPDSYVTYDDEDRRVYRVSLTDLERNVTYHEDAIVPKVIERKSPKRGDVVLRERENSSGGTTFTVRANDGDSELENRYAAEISKRTRKLGLRILPIDLVDEAIAQCRATLELGRKAEDPAAARKRITDAFAEIGVMPRDLDLYLGHALASSSPAEMEDLRTVYRSIRDGETTWAEMLEQQSSERGQEPSKTTDDLKSKLAEKAAAAKTVEPKDAQKDAPSK